MLLNVRLKEMRKIALNGGLFFIYGMFVIFLCLYLRGVIRYRGVESWPSVSAEVIRVGGERVSFPITNRSGIGSSATIDARFVEFSYTVSGESYQGTMASPDGGGLPLNPFGQPWRAYYKPSAPEIAVLNPVPFEGLELFTFSVVFGLLIGGHLCFSIPDLLVRR